MGPLPPTASRAIGHLILHDENAVGDRDTTAVGRDYWLGTGQCQPPAAMRQFSGKVPHRIATTELRIVPKEIGLVAGYYEVRAWGNDRTRSKGKMEAGRKTP